MNKQCDFAKPKSKPSKSNPDASKVLTYLSAERVHRISVVTLCKFRCRSTMNASRSKSLCWNDDTSYALGLYRLISNSLGIWPLTCHEFGSKVIFVIAIILQVRDGNYLLGEILYTLDDSIFPNNRVFAKKTTTKSYVVSFSTLVYLSGGEVDDFFPTVTCSWNSWTPRYLTEFFEDYRS